MKTVIFLVLLTVCAVNSYAGSNNGEPETANPNSTTVAPGDPRLKIRKSGGKSDGNGGIGYNTVEQDINTNTNVWTLICQGAGLEPCVFSIPGISQTGTIDEIDFQRAIEVADELYVSYYNSRKDNDSNQLVISIPSEDKLRIYNATLIELEFGVVEIEVVISKL